MDFLAGVGTIGREILLPDLKAIVTPGSAAILAGLNLTIPAGVKIHVKYFFTLICGV